MTVSCARAAKVVGEDYPRTLIDLGAQFSTRRACREYLVQLRWVFSATLCGRGRFGLECFMTDTNSLNLMHLMDRFGTDAKCRNFLEDVRWPKGKVECPHCGCKKLCGIPQRNQWHCRACLYQFSVTSGTVFHDSHLPLRKWMIAIYLMLESKKAISANQMKRTLGRTVSCARAAKPGRPRRPPESAWSAHSAESRHR